MIKKTIFYSASTSLVVSVFTCMCFDSCWRYNIDQTEKLLTSIEFNSRTMENRSRSAYARAVRYTDKKLYMKEFRDSNK